jgi:hypothetical protein
MVDLASTQKLAYNEGQGFRLENNMFIWTPIFFYILLIWFLLI